jgi:hypothetical protein
MNNESGSALQKASFVLLMFIAAALAYLIVRDRIRADQQRAEAERIAATAPLAPPQAAQRPINPAEMKSSFAPLRPRVETNTIRLPANRGPTVPPANSSSLIQPAATDANAPIGVTSLQASDRPVAAATTSGRGGSQPGAAITGRVTLHGKPSAEKPITLDPMCARLHAKPLMTRHYVVGDHGGLANTFVYIKAGAPPTSPSVPAPLLDQVACEYQPYVMGVQTGQSFNVRNSDPFLHNVHTQPVVAGNKERNIGQPIPMSSPFVFARPEVFVKFKCQVHPWMFAYVGVVDHPWFAVTDSDGNFAFSTGLPAGEYTIAAVHQKAGESVKQITVPESGVVPVNFTLDVPGTVAQTNAP